MPRDTSEKTVPDTPMASRRPEAPKGLPERYKLQDVIGEGGMGRVYRARDLTLGRDVAIKMLEGGELHGTDATKQRERFVREARAAARLAHPNIVAVHDVDPDAGWLVMDLVEGKPLKELGKTKPALVRRIAEQTLSALDTAHAAGVIHRDIKPSNIMIDAHGKVTLVDFGVARLVDAELTRTGESLGTPAYMAPEQIRGATVDERTDLYGLGATLFELVSGERMVAFESPSQTTIDQLASHCPSDPALVELIRRSLQAEPKARPASARDALAILAQRPRRRWPFFFAAPISVAAIAALALLSRRHHSDARRDEAIRLVQRGEAQKADVVLDAYLVDHPDDAEAQTMKLLATWWKNGVFEDAAWQAVEGKLEPDQRAMLRGIYLIAQHREGDAIAFLDDYDRGSPGSPEVLYAIGEAHWHDGRLEQGAETLARAFKLDPHWYIALDHVRELRLSRGETAIMRPLADQLRTVDPAAAAALDCEIAIADRKYRDAAAGAAAALTREEPIPELYTCLAQAQILTGDLAAAEATTKRGAEALPTDLREWGEQSLASELVLYRGNFDQYVEHLPGVRGTRQAQIATAMWQPPSVEDPPAEVPTTPWAPVPGHMRAPPIGNAIDILQHHVHGRDALNIYVQDPEPEVRGWGYGLAAELRGDLATAAGEYRKALAAPQKGDMRMLLAHALARVDRAHAADACVDVLTPRVYQSYRAVLLPDCVLWTGDKAAIHAFLATWTGGFAHPAVVEMRALDSGKPVPQSPP